MSPVIVDPVEQTSRPVRVALDFDGVLHSYTSGYTGPIPFDPPVLGAQTFCAELIRRGYVLSIFTTRAHPLLEREQRKAFVEYLERTTAGELLHPVTGWKRVGAGPSVGTFAIRAWLKHYGFPEEMQTCEITHKKTHADLYIDDRGWRFEPSTGFGDLLSWLTSNPLCKTWTGRI